MDNLYLWIEGVEGLDEVINSCMDKLNDRKHELEGTLNKIKEKKVKGKPYCYIPNGTSGSWKYIGKGPIKDNPFVKNIQKELLELEEKLKTKKKELNKFVNKKVNNHLIISKEFLPIIKEHAWNTPDTIKLSELFSYPSSPGSALRKMDNKKRKKL